MSQLSTELLTLTRCVLADQRKHSKASGDLTLLLISIQLGCKFVATSVRKAGLINLTGLANDGNGNGPSVNIQGEQQKKLDVLANAIFINSLRSSGKVNVMVSEENPNAIFVEDGLKGKYCVVFDPLDGSSNIDCGVSIGTIFGIYQEVEGKIGIGHVLRPGKEMVAAGYCMYGSSTMFVLSTGEGVHGYTLDTSIGEFILTHPNLRIPERGSIYSVNEGNSVYWDKQTKQYIERLKSVDSPIGKPYSARYVGSMVADMHRTLLYGGIFCYPADSKSKNGKLRLLYECFPMAYLVEKAGGKATTGKQPILDIMPKDIHERAPIFLGSRLDVEDIETIYQ